MRANPEPKPIVIAVTAGDGTIISCDANRPCAMVGFQTFQLQAGMRGISEKLLKGVLRGSADLRRQSMIQPPEIGCAARGHFLARRDLSFITRNFSGDCECSASNSSSSDENAGRGDSSFKMASHPSAGNASGQSAGISFTSWRRDLDGSLAMASSISSNDFTMKKCDSFENLSMI